MKGVRTAERPAADLVLLLLLPHALTNGQEKAVKGAPCVPHTQSRGVIVPALQRGNAALDAPASGMVQRHGMLADTFPVGRIGDATARTMDRCRWGRIRSVMPVTWGFLANDRACRPAAGLSGMVSMVTLERHDGVPTRERGNDQDQSINKGVLC